MPHPPLHHLQRIHQFTILIESFGSCSEWCVWTFIMSDSDGVQSAWKTFTSHTERFGAKFTICPNLISRCYLFHRQTNS